MLHVHTAGRIEPMAERLAELLVESPADPMTAEWIAVPSEGMRRWLHLELARRLGAGPRGGDGIAANIDSRLPSSLRLQVLRAGRPTEAADPWLLERLTWSVLEALSDAGSDPVLSPLAARVEGSSAYERARRVADLFDRYHLHRADMVRSWAQGHDVDGSGRALVVHHRWQPVLWRAVRARIDEPSPPERIPILLDGLHDGSIQVDLPDRLSMFGLSVLPGGAGFLDLAEAVGASRELHLFLVEPSPAAAARVADQVEPAGPVARLRGEDPTASLVRHPLLRSWGRLHRETSVLLADGVRQGVAPVERSIGGPRTASAGPELLLHRLQRELRDDSAPSGDLEMDRPDESISLHCAHGTTRQVEVLRDLLLHLLADEELALVEDEILVLTPALDQLAPVIEATFGPSAESHRTAAAATPSLRYRIADRSIRTVNPLLQATEMLLDLVAGRFDATSVMDLVSLGPVRHRFRFDDDDVARIGEWVDLTRIRWGLDADQRDRVGVPAEFDTNTWRAGLDRLLTGLAIVDDQHLALGDVVPLALGGDDVGLAGRLAELIWRLGELAGEVPRDRPLHEWLDVVRDAVDLCCSVPPVDGWQRDALGKELAGIENDAGGGDGSGERCEVPLSFLDLRRLLADRLSDAPGRPDFFRGGLTVSSMTPLRGVPHRVIILIGVDQPAFSVGAPDGDDLATAAPLMGDRDRRGDSRQSLLDAVMAARERLVVIREGHDVRTNHVVPPAVPVAELLDTLTAMVHPEHRRSFTDRLELHHPRQPFDEAVFTAGALDPGITWGFDRSAFDGAVARRGRDDVTRSFLSTPFPPTDEPVIDLAELQSFLKDPVPYFVRRRLGVRLPSRAEPRDPNLPLVPANLEKWSMGNRLFEWLLDGGDPAEWQEVEARRGTLGPGVLGAAALDDITASVEELVTAVTAAGVRLGPSVPVPVDVRLGDGTRVVGSVEGRLEGTPGPARLTYSSARPAYRLAAWLDLVALVGSDPTSPWRSVGVHRSDKAGRAPVVVDLHLRAAADDPDEMHRVAVDALEVAVDCYRRGTAEPVPLFPRVSHAAWTGTYSGADWLHPMGWGDGAHPMTAMVFAGLDLRSLRALPRRDGDPRPPGRHGTSRLECFAAHLWGSVDRSVRDVGTDSDATSGDGR